jgi:hypothetical protein
MWIMTTSWSLASADIRTSSGRVFFEKTWVKERFKEGLIIKTLYSVEDGAQGMIEFIPGEYC